MEVMEDAVDAKEVVFTYLVSQCADHSVIRLLS